MNPTQNLHNTPGMIVFTQKNIPLFLAQTDNPFPDFKTLATGVSLSRFQDFIRFAVQVGAMHEGANFTFCCFNTFRELYKDFEKMEFNRNMTAVLYQLDICPDAPEVHRIDFPAVNGKFMFWLIKTRSWLQLQLARVSLLAPRPDKLNLTKKKARGYHTTGQDKCK